MSKEVKWLAFAFQIQPDGRSVELDESRCQEALDSGAGLVWLHLDLQAPEARRWLQRDSHLDPMETEALMAEATRPRLSLLPHGVLMNLRGLNARSQHEMTETISVRCWFEENRVITASRFPLQALEKLAEMARAGHQLQSAGAIASYLIDILVEDIGTYVDGLEEELDTLVEQIDSAPEDVVREAIHRLQRQAILLRRFIAPQQLALGKFSESEISWLTPRSRRRTMEAANEISRLVEVLNFVWERAQIIREDLQMRSTGETNRRLYLLSILSAIFLPLSFVTGLLGVNVGGIPGAESHQAFAVLCLLIAMLAMAFGWWLKRSRWF